MGDRACRQVVELGERILELELENSTTEHKVRQASKVRSRRPTDCCRGWSGRLTGLWVAGVGGPNR